MRIKNILFALLLTVVSSPLVMAGEFEDAVDAYNKQDYKTALRLFKSEAQQGSAPAQYNIGLMYVEGQGVPQDFAEAVKWFRLAAQQELARAQYHLGLMYYKGQGVPQDYTEALKWYRLAAQQENTLAQVDLGAMYAVGQGVPKSYVRAHLWFNLSASSGNVSAIQGRELVTSRMTSEQIAEAKKMARDCTTNQLKDCN